jgi:uncharacterized lipoprotein
MKKIIFTIATICLLTSCSKSTKKTLGLTEDMPDELQVSKAKPLEVPPHFNHVHPAPKEKKIPANTKLSPAEEAALKEATDE